MATEGTQKDNLINMSKSVYEALMPGSNLPPFQSYEEFFSFIDTHSKERIILAIDEYPYLAEGDKAISSVIQTHIDQYLKDS